MDTTFKSALAELALSPLYLTFSFYYNYFFCINILHKHTQHQTLQNNQQSQGLVHSCVFNPPSAHKCHDKQRLT